MPPVRTRDNLDLPPRTYAIRMFGVEVARGQAPAGTVLAIGDGLERLPGRPTQEPVFGLAGKWVPLELRQPGRAGRRHRGGPLLGASSPTSPRSSASTPPPARPRGRPDAHRGRQAHPPGGGRGAHPGQLTLGEIQRVLQALLDEGVSIRDLVRIFEALSLRARVGQRPGRPGRGRPGRARPRRSSPRTSPTAPLHVITFEPGLEQRLLEALRPAETGGFLAVDPDLGQRMLGQLAGLVRRRAAERDPGAGLRAAAAVRRASYSSRRRCPGCRSSPTPS